MNKEIAKNIAFKEYNQADKIIRYLLNPNDKTVELLPTEKQTLDYCRDIHTLRSQFNSKKEIVLMMVSMHGISEGWAYKLIKETEQIFGKTEGVHKDYERNFLVEQSRKNIQLAMNSQNSGAISKALMAHYKIVGLDEFVPDMPDFASLEQHQYMINLPNNVIDLLKGLIKSGNVKFSDIIPPPKYNTSGIQPAEEVNNDPA